MKGRPENKCELLEIKDRIMEIEISIESVGRKRITEVVSRLDKRNIQKKSKEKSRREEILK